MRGPTTSSSTLPAILGYCITSNVMTLTNKFVLSSYEFHMNFFLLASQSLLCVGVLFAFTSSGSVTYRAMNKPDIKKWYPVVLALIAMIYTGSKATQYLSIPMFLIFKNVTTIIIAYGEVTFYKGSPVTNVMLVSFLMMVFSSAIAGFDDLKNGNFLKDASVGVFVPYTWMALNCLTTAMYSLFLRSKIGAVGFKDYDTVYYNNLLSLPLLLVLSILFEGEEFYKTVERYTVTVPGDFPGLVISIALSGVTTFGIGYCSSWCIRTTSSTTFSMIGSLNKLPLAFLGLFLFNDPFTLPKVAGLLIATTGGYMYTRAKQAQNAEKAKYANKMLQQEELRMTSLQMEDDDVKR